MLWLQNLGLAGGNAADTTFVLDTLYVDAENTTLYVRDVDDMLTVYLHGKTTNNTSQLKVVKVDWTKWLGSSSISTSTWTVDDTTLTLSNDSNSTVTATVYIGPASIDAEYWLVNTIVTDDAVARTESRSIRVKVVRRV